MSTSHAPTDLTTTFHLPALKIWNALPVEPLRLIEWFALHEHKFQIMFPDGFRDNNEYTCVCRVCGYSLWRASSTEFTFVWSIALKTSPLRTSHQRIRDHKMTGILFRLKIPNKIPSLIIFTSHIQKRLQCIFKWHYFQDLIAIKILNLVSASLYSIEIHN